MIKEIALIFLIFVGTVGCISAGAKLEDALTASVNAVKTYKQQGTKVALFILILALFSGCASYNQKLICAQVATNNASIPYVGGQSSGYVTACYFSCLGGKCPIPDDGTALAKAVATAISQTNNTIITSGAVKITATPLK